MPPIRTNWIVFTGAPCSGKTTVLEELKRLGYDYYPEVARVVIEDALRKGLSLAEIRADEGRFQQNLVDRKAKIEVSTPVGKTVFFDRAMPDSIAYFRKAGLDPSPLKEICTRFVYKAVFLFDRLPLRDDGVRVEDERAAILLGQELEREYTALGYQVVHVPVAPVPERLQFIVKCLGMTC